MPFLGFDLSTPATLVVVKTSDDGLYHRILPGDNRAERLFPAIHEALEEAAVSPRELRSLGVGRGPGAFTGVRNAVMAAKTFSHALKIPLYSPPPWKYWPVERSPATWWSPSSTRAAGRYIAPSGHGRKAV